MLRAELEHIIRASCRAIGQDQVLVIGSQSILGTYGEYELPEESTFSEEADVIPFIDDEAGTTANRIDGAIGELTLFHEQFGYYAQGVGRRTALLPTGWEERLVPLRNERTEYFTGWCLDVHDLCSSKLLANREKDRAFVAALITANLVSVGVIRSRLDLTDTDNRHKEIAMTWLSMWPDNQAEFVPPTLPHFDRSVPSPAQPTTPVPPQNLGPSH